MVNEDTIKKRIAAPGTPKEIALNTEPELS